MITQINPRITTSFVNESKMKKRIFGLAKALLTLLRNFAELSTMHGFSRAFRRDRGKLEW